MIPQINQTEWVSMRIETREELRKLFGIPKSSSAIVETDSMGKSRVMSDGCTNADLQYLTIQKMMDYLEGEVTPDDNIHTLLNKVVARIEGKPKETPMTINKPVEGAKKCEYCAFETASKFALRMHVGKNHKNR